VERIFIIKKAWLALSKPEGKSWEKTDVKTLVKKGKDNKIQIIM
jgi:hypothetical protein